MSNPELLKHFRGGMAKGQSIDNIRNQLIQQGWALNDVDEAALEVRPTKVIEEKKPRPTAITFLGSLGLLISSGFVFFGLYLMVQGFVSISGATSLLNNLSSFVPFIFLLVTPRMVSFQVLLASLYLLLIGLVGILTNVQLLRLKQMGFWLFMISQSFVLGGSIVSGNFLSIHGAFIPILLGIYLLASKEIFSS
ncbi:MAG: hypothetical protein GOU98_04555 [Candidatus Altiarchaeota archaeon]|nr:hypothetical protein [Candidatus Altiarchaeota archaeon]